MTQRNHQPQPIQALDFMPSAQQSRPVVSEFDGQLIDSVFAKLKILFPIGAPKPEQEPSMKAEWLKTLVAQRIGSVEVVQRGINRARCERDGKRQFWPSPLQFCHWCHAEPDDLGLPSVEQAYREAMRHYSHVAKHKWSHAIVRLALRESGGSWLFGASAADDSFKVFERNYTMLIRRYANGEEIDFNLPKALPTRVTRPTAANKARANIADLRVKFGLRTTKGANDE
ncbi:replication protein P [Shewanella algae]|uniref:replication protein P n=1 Tax=Shewanella algae TaxID=38313 RepID=UPI001AACFDF6|nr:replication protein P [Shewanella algae]MBO2658117.1 replication protein P [Shewanella algae]